MTSARNGSRHTTPLPPAGRVPTRADGAPRPPTAAPPMRGRQDRRFAAPRGPRTGREPRTPAQARGAQGVTGACGAVSHVARCGATSRRRVQC
eukprot:7186034-Prymnesium_polylepis.1